MFLGLEDDCFVSNSYGRGFFSQSFCTVKPWMSLFYVYSRSSQVWTQTKNYGPLHRQLILNVIRPNGKRSIPDLHLLHKNNLWKFTRTYQNPPPSIFTHIFFDGLLFSRSFQDVSFSAWCLKTFSKDIYISQIIKVAVQEIKAFHDSTLLCHFIIFLEGLFFF